MKKLRDLIFIFFIPTYAFIEVTWLRNQLYADWDSKTIFFPMIHFVKNVIFGNFSFAFAEQWFTGSPFLADYQTGCFNIYTWIGAFLMKILGSNRLGFNLVIYLTNLVISLGQFIFLSHFTQSRWLRIYGTIGLLYLGSLYLHHSSYVHITSLSFLPWICHFSFSYFKERKIKDALLACILFTLQVCMGCPFVWFATGIIVFAGSFLLPWKERIIYWAYMALGLGLSAPQLIPFQEYVKISVRGVQDLKYIYAGSLHPFMLSRYLVPYIFGGRVSAIYNQAYYGPSDEGLYECFTGYLPIATVLIAFYFFVRKKSLASEVKVFLGLCVFFLLYALGKYVPLIHVFQLIPGLKDIRNPTRATFIISFCIWPIACFLLDRYRAEILPSLRKILFVFLALIISLYFLTHTNFYLSAYPPYTYPPKDIAFIIPILSLMGIIFILPIKKEWIFLVIGLLEIFVMNTFDIRGLSPNKISHKETYFFENQRYAAPFYFSEVLLADGYSIFGYSSAEPLFYANYLGIEDTKLVNVMSHYSKEMCAHLSREKFKEMAVNYLFEELPPDCPSILEDFSLQEGHWVRKEPIPHIFESNSPLTTHSENKMFTYRKKILLEKPSDFLSIRHLYFPGMNFYYDQAGAKMPAILESQEAMKIKIKSLVPTQTFWMEYEIPGFKKGIFVFLISLILLLSSYIYLRKPHYNSKRY